MEKETGTIKKFNFEKNYGFISRGKDKEDVFFHQSQMTENVAEGDKVSFYIVEGQKGLSAKDITKQI